MSKELEALERIKNAPTIYVGCASDIYTRYPFECKEIEKSLKALEIINEKLNIDIFTGIYVKYCLSLKSMTNAMEITQEEYDLLKEELL